MFSPPTPPRKRCKRYDIPGHAHYLTFSCHRRLPLLADDSRCRWLCVALNDARQRVSFDLWAWVIMPEHVHLLVHPHEGTLISEVLRHVKLPVARRATAQARRGDNDLAALMRHSARGGNISYRLWQRGGGYDRNIWTAAEMLEKIEYIHANPVRRGLVDHPRHWPWSSWRTWYDESDNDDLVRIDRESVPAM